MDLHRAAEGILRRVQEQVGTSVETLECGFR